MSVAQLVSVVALMEGNEVNVPLAIAALWRTSSFASRQLSPFQACHQENRVALSIDSRGGDSSLPWKLHFNIECVSEADKWLPLNHQVVFNQW